MIKLFDFFSIFITFYLIFLAGFVAFLTIQFVVYHLTGYSLYNMRYIKKKNKQV